MQGISIVRESIVKRTPRVLQLEGIFDIPPSKKTSESWIVSFPLEEKSWNVGLIVGPSGCGKTTIINELFRENIYNEFQWDGNLSILDGFPESMGVKEVVKILNSVGFSSPPSWVRPYHVLSNGEKFRVNVARAIVESNDLCVIDEFTSIVDRTVGKMGSAAIAKTVRKQNKKFIDSSCHYDIEEWLDPDWVYKPHENEFQWRYLQQRPKINLKIIKVHRKAWKIFSKHHYLTSKIHNGAQCFVAFYEDIPVAFFSYIHFMNNRLKKTKKGHRLVVLPDYQGVGIGTVLIEYIASCLKALGFDFIGRTSSPGVIYQRAKSKKWKMIRKPELSINKGRSGIKNSVKHLNRVVCSFRYVGPQTNILDAQRLILQ